MTAPGQKVWDAPNPTTDVQDDTAVEPASGDQLSAFFTSAEDSDPVGHPDSKRKGLSISVKATALAALFGILPVLTVGFIGYRSANVSITGEIAGQELEEVEQIASLIGTYLQERIADASTIAGVVSSFPEIAGGLNAEEQSNLSDLQEFLSAQLASSIQGTPSYSGIGIFDRQGESLIQTVGAGVELNQDDVSYFEQAIETETATLSKPVLETAESGLEEYAVYIAAPVISAAERVESVVLARIALDTVGYSVLSSGVSEDEEEEGDEFYRLVDDSSNILQSLPFKAENPEIGQSIAEKVSNFEAVQEQREPTTWIGSTTDGTALIAYAPVSEIENLGWSVVASEGTAEAFAPQRQLLATILLGTTVTSIAAVLLGIVLAKRATRPIEQAAKTVELLGQGNLYARMPVRGDDEVAVLGRNINQMAGQIEGLLQTLRQNATQLGKQNQVLLDLARDEVLIKGDAQAAAQTFGAVAAATLDVERVSFWLYKPELGQLRCLSYHDRTRPDISPPPIALDSAYVQALLADQGLTISDVHSHSEAQTLIESGHLDESTVSLLEVPIQITGKIVGTVRCEQTGDRRRWEPQERTFVGSIANLAALALESEGLQAEVSHLLDVVSEVEDGNLTIEAQVSDRSTGLVADTFNRLIERLAEVMQQALETAQQVSQNARQQTGQADLIAKNADQQAEGINQILQITNGVKALALDAAQQVETSRTSLETLKQAVERGRGEITSMTTGIEILQEGSDRIIQQMKTLGEFVGLADQFVQDQTQIASLTQTLALNASLVAARSAEQRDPRQFAVAAREFGAIASQVSQLAQQTNASLTSLEQRSAQIQSVVYTVDANVQRVGNLVEGFTQGVEESSQVFEDVQTVTTAALEAETSVTRASQEIVDAAEAATDVVRRITETADQTAELTRNNRMQSEEMESLSQQLVQTMVFFQLPGTPAPEAQPQLEMSRAQDVAMT